MSLIKVFVDAFNKAANRNPAKEAIDSGQAGTLGSTPGSYSGSFDPLRPAPAPEDQGGAGPIGDLTVAQGVNPREPRFQEAAPGSDLREGSPYQVGDTGPTTATALTFEGDRLDPAATGPIEGLSADPTLGDAAGPGVIAKEDNDIVVTVGEAVLEDDIVVTVGEAVIEDDFTVTVGEAILEEDEGSWRDKWARHPSDEGSEASPDDPRFGNDGTRLPGSLTEPSVQLTSSDPEEGGEIAGGLKVDPATFGATQADGLAIGTRPEEDGGGRDGALDQVFVDGPGRVTRLPGEPEGMNLPGEPPDGPPAEELMVGTRPEGGGRDGQLDVVYEEGEAAGTAERPNLEDFSFVKKVDQGSPMALAGDPADGEPVPVPYPNAPSDPALAAAQADPGMLEHKQELDVESFSWGRAEFAAKGQHLPGGVSVAAGDVNDAPPGGTGEDVLIGGRTAFDDTGGYPGKIESPNLKFTISEEFSHDAATQGNESDLAFLRQEADLDDAFKDPGKVEYPNVSFGVEREMKESGEKGGTEDVGAQFEYKPALSQADLPPEPEPGDTTVDFLARKAGGKQEEYLTVKMEETLVTSFRPGGTESDPEPGAMDPGSLARKAGGGQEEYFKLEIEETLVSSDSPASSDYGLLKLGDIKGESGDAKHKDELEFGDDQDSGAVAFKMSPQQKADFDLKEAMDQKAAFDLKVQSDQKLEEYQKWSTEQKAGVEYKDQFESDVRGEVAAPAGASMLDEESSSTLVDLTPARSVEQLEHSGGTFDAGDIDLDTDDLGELSELQ